MRDEPGTLLALVAFLATALAPAAFALRRGHRLFAPTVVFPLGYALMTAGPSLWFLLTRWYYVGVVRDHAVSVLLSCASACLAFQVGAWLVARRPADAGGKGCGNVAVEHGVRRLSWLLLAIALLAYGAISIRMRQEVGPADKSELLALATPASLRAYTLAAAAIQALGLLFVAVESRLRPGRLTPALLVLLGVYGALCVWNRERDVFFLGLGWLVLNAHLLRRRAIVATALLGLFVAAVPVLRLGDIRGAEGEAVPMGRRLALLAGSLLTQTSSNFYVYSNVIDWVPAWSEHRHGMTYVEALASFLPESIGGEKRSLAGWFKDRYAPRSTVGYGFAMDAEAYLNFGWAGPPLVFLVWGLVLGLIYRRAGRSDAGSLHAFIWILALSSSLYAVRMESRVLLKLVVLGGLGGVGLHWLAGLPAEIRALVTRRAVSP